MLATDKQASDVHKPDTKCRQTDKQIERQTDEKMEKQANRHPGRQTNKQHKQPNNPYCGTFLPIMVTKSGVKTNGARSRLKP